MEDSLFAGKWKLQCQDLVLICNTGKSKLGVGCDGKDYTEESFSRDGEKNSTNSCYFGVCNHYFDFQLFTKLSSCTVNIQQMK